jgi:surface antigen
MRHFQICIAAIGSVTLSACASILPEPDAAIYQALDETDVEIASATIQKSLETRSEGDRIEWQNANSGNGGSVIVGETFIDRTGAFCRHYEETVSTADGNRQTLENVACRSEDGNWRWI